jgi:hypothetical protein
LQWVCFLNKALVCALVYFCSLLLSVPVSS